MDMPNKKMIIISAAIVICVLACLTYFLIAGRNQRENETSGSQELKALKEKNDYLRKELASLEEEINKIKGQRRPTDKIEKVFGGKSAMLSIQERDLAYKEIEQLIMSYFAYLDEMGYVNKNKLSGSAYDQYMIMENDLSAVVPISSGETENLYNLLQNTTYFYRILGKQRLQLVKDIISDDSDMVEFAMKTFYMWYTYENDNGKRMKGQPSLKVLYDYSGFFLNSMGGKSYLLRRDSKIRILINFYSILIVDIANDKNLNSNGIDIRPYIKTTYDDIAENMGLSYKMEYINVLERLKTKYRIS